MHQLLKPIGYILLLLSPLSARAADKPPLPTEEPIGSYSAAEQWQKSHSPEGLVFQQLLAYPVGLGYFQQGETNLGLWYAGLQGSLLLAGALGGGEMSSSSWTQLLPPLSMSLWLASLAHVDDLARKKNRAQGFTPPLNPTFLQQAGSDSQVSPTLHWSTQIALPILFQADSPPMLAPAFSVQADYQLGPLLARFLGPWATGFYITTNLKLLVPYTQSQGQPNFAELIRQAPGVELDTGLIYAGTTSPWTWSGGILFNTLWRTTWVTGTEKNEWPRATYQGWGMSGGISYQFHEHGALSLRLQGSYLAPNGKSDMSNIVGIWMIQPDIGLQFTL